MAMATNWMARSSSNSKFHVDPLANREDGLGGGHAIVRNEDIADGAVDPARLDVLPNSIIGGGGGLVEGGCPEGGVNLCDV